MVRLVRLVCLPWARPTTLILVVVVVVFCSFAAFFRSFDPFFLFNSFLSHFKFEAATEARLCQIEMEKMLGCPCFLDSDNLQDLRELLDHVKNSDVLVLLQTTGLLTRPWCLLEIVTAIKAGVPIVAINIKG